MYETSEAYKQAVRGKYRRFKMEGTITLRDGREIPISDDNIKQGGVTIDNQCISNQEFEFGAVYAGQLKAALNLDIDRYSLYDAVIKLSCFLFTDDMVTEEIPMGVYNINEATRSFKSVSIKALDNMLLLDVDYGNISLVGTPYEILVTVSETTGIELGMTREYVESLPNGKEMVSVPATFSIDTWRELISYLGVILCCFATFDRNGRFVFKRFQKEPVTVIDDTFRTSSEYADFTVQYTSVETMCGGQLFLSKAEEDTGLRMSIPANPFMQLGMEFTRQRLLDNIFAELKDIVYVPASASIYGDPSIELGDMIKYTGGTAGEGICGLVTGYTYTYRGKHELKGAGKNPKLASAKTQSDKMIGNMPEKIAEKDIVYYNYINSKDYLVKKDRMEIVFINYTSSKSGTAEFKASVLLNATADSGKAYTKVKVIYRINDAEIVTYYPTELYADGPHILVLYYPLGFDADRINRMQVYMEAEDGSISIHRMHILASISGQSLVAEGTGWNGLINVDEECRTYEVQALAVNKFADNVSCTKRVENRNSHKEVFADMRIPVIVFEDYENKTEE